MTIRSIFEEDDDNHTDTPKSKQQAHARARNQTTRRTITWNTKTLNDLERLKALVKGPKNRAFADLVNEMIQDGLLKYAAGKGKMELESEFTITTED